MKLTFIVIPLTILCGTKALAQTETPQVLRGLPRTPQEETQMGNNFNYRSAIDLGTIAEGTFMRFKVRSSPSRTYGSRYFPISPSDIFGYLIPENSGIISVSLSDGGYSVTLNTKDHYGNYHEQVEVSTRFGIFYLDIQAQIYDKETLQALRNSETAKSEAFNKY